MTVELRHKPLTAKDFKGKVDPDWCPGCGDFALLRATQMTVAKLGLQPHEIVCVSGIGCSSNFPGFFGSYGMHTLHGRALAVATGVKMANQNLTILVTGGDGDGYGIGGNHFTHTARRNVDLTYLVMNNQIYGLTTGQVSPSSSVGMKTKSTPFGNVERPVNPITSAIMNGATYVARGFSGNIKQLRTLIEGAINHPGFAVIDVFSPCVTFNRDNTYAFFRGRVVPLEKEGHDPGDWKSACERAMEWGDRIYTGLFFQDPTVAPLHALEPILDDAPPVCQVPEPLTATQADRIIQRMM